MITPLCQIAKFVCVLAVFSFSFFFTLSVFNFHSPILKENHWVGGATVVELLMRCGNWDHRVVSLVLALSFFGVPSLFSIEL